MVAGFGQRCFLAEVEALAVKVEVVRRRIRTVKGEAFDVRPCRAVLGGEIYERREGSV